MSSDPLDGFVSNWAYLKAELAWLDRLLGLAVARQRQDRQAIERVAHSRADRVTSHWWQGLIALDREAGYDECSPQKLTQQNHSTRGSYQQQLETRIQTSRQQGIGLGLPRLCDRLHLTSFEKNLILMSLAPEINRRYAKLYSYLQGSNESPKEGRISVELTPTCSSFELPTVDLALRLLCRTDLEWRKARAYLNTQSRLVQSGLLKLVACGEEPLLARRLKLIDPLVDYLLAENPTDPELDTLLQLTSLSPERRSLRLQQVTPSTTWQQLILPAPLLRTLQHLGDRVQFWPEVEQVWQTATQQPKSASPLVPGLIVMLLGSTGTGKTMAAEAIAHHLSQDLTYLDLACLPPQDFPQLMQVILAQAPKVLLLKSAHLWLGRTSGLDEADLHLFWQQRQQQLGITLFSAASRQTLKQTWRQQADQVLEFPWPNPGDRLKLWQQTFPATVPLDPGIDWQLLAHKFSLSGGEIRAIAQAATIYAAADSPTLKVKMAHILQALQQKTAKQP